MLERVQFAETVCTIPDRLKSRRSVPRAERGSVELPDPSAAGRRRSLSLLDVSAEGLCFVMPGGGLAGIRPSSRLSGVVVRIGDCEIEGQLLVSHVTRESPERVLCGGRFVPAGEAPRLKWIKAIAGLESSESF